MCRPFLFNYKKSYIFARTYVGEDYKSLAFSGRNVAIDKTFVV